MRDILRMCPDIEAHAAGRFRLRLDVGPSSIALRCLEKERPGLTRIRLRMRLADRSLVQTNPLLAVAAKLLALAAAALLRPRCSTWLMPHRCEHDSDSPTTISEDITRWVEQANIRWL